MNGRFRVGERGGGSERKRGKKVVEGSALTKPRAFNVEKTHYQRKELKVPKKKNNNQKSRRGREKARQRGWEETENS